MTNANETTTLTTLATRIRDARAAGMGTLYATLLDKFRGCRVVRFSNLTGEINGNPHDVWVKTVSGVRTIGRFDARGGAELEAWAARVAGIEAVRS